MIHGTGKSWLRQALQDLQYRHLAVSVEGSLGLAKLTRKFPRAYWAKSWLLAVWKWKTYIWIPTGPESDWITVIGQVGNLSNTDFILSLWILSLWPKKSSLQMFWKWENKLSFLCYWKIILDGLLNQNIFKLNSPAGFFFPCFLKQVKIPFQRSVSENSLVAMDFSGQIGRVIENPAEAQSAALEEGHAWRVDIFSSFLFL